MMYTKKNYSGSYTQGFEYAMTIVNNCDEPCLYQVHMNPYESGSMEHKCFEHGFADGVNTAKFQGMVS